MKKVGLFLFFTIYLFAYNNISTYYNILNFKFKTPEEQNKLIQQLYKKNKIFQEYEKKYKQELKKRIVKQINNSIQRFGVPLNIQDVTNIKKNIELKATEMLNKQLYSLGKNYFYGALNINDIKNLIGNIPENLNLKSLNMLVERNFEKTIINSITSEFGSLKGIGGFGICCCGAIIEKRISQIGKYVIPKIQHEIKNIIISEHLIKNIEMINEKRFGKKWNNKIFGKINKNNLINSFLLSQAIFNSKKMDKEIYLEIESSLNTAKSLVILNKEILYNNNKEK